MFPSIPTFVRLYHEWMLNFVKCLFCVCEDDHVVFVLSLCGISQWLTCVCWIILENLGWILLGCNVWSSLYIVGFSLLMFCWEFLHLYSMKTLTCNFIFLVVCFILVSVMVDSYRVFESVPSSSVFFERVWKGLV